MKRNTKSLKIVFQNVNATMNAIKYINIAIFFNIFEYNDSYITPIKHTNHTQTTH